MSNGKELAKRQSQDIELFSDSDMNTLMMIMMMVLIMPTMLQPMLQRMQTQQVQSQQFEGFGDDKNLDASVNLSWVDLINNSPYHSWITASFYNDSIDPNAVAYIAINLPTNFTELRYHETWNYSASGGDRHIDVIFFKTLTGNALVRAVGKY